MEGWKDEQKSRVFFNKNDMQAYLVIRRQRAGNSYMHAVVSFVRYVMAKRDIAQKYDHKMVDISSYMKDHFSSDDITEYIKTGGGGNSLRFLESITGITARQRTVVTIPGAGYSVGIKKEIQNNLLRIIEVLFEKNFEPALVYVFFSGGGFRYPGVVSA
jgi:hypothetical protein